MQPASSKSWRWAEKMVGTSRRTRPSSAVRWDLAERSRVTRAARTSSGCAEAVGEQDTALASSDSGFSASCSTCDRRRPSGRLTPSGRPRRKVEEVGGDAEGGEWAAEMAGAGGTEAEVVVGCAPGSREAPRGMVDVPSA